MKNPLYDYVFRHNTIKATLRFQARSIQEATTILATMVSTIADWNMKRYKHK